MCIYWNEKSSSVQITHLLLLSLCCAAAVFPILSPTCHRRRESISLNHTSPRVPAQGRGRIRLLRSVVVIACWTFSSLYAGIRGFPSTVYFVYYCAISSTDNPTVIMMPTLTLLFVIAFLLLLALQSLSLPRIVVLVLIDTPMIYAVVFSQY